MRLFLNNYNREKLRFIKVTDYEEWLNTYQGIEGIINLETVGPTEWNFVVGKGSALFGKLNDLRQQFLGIVNLGLPNQCQ